MDNDLDKIIEDQLCVHSNILRGVSEEISKGNWEDAETSLQGLYTEVAGDGCEVCIDLMDNVMTDFNKAKSSPTGESVKEIEDTLDLVIQAFCP